MILFQHPAGSMVTSDARYSCKSKSTFATTKAACINKKTLFTSKLDLNLRKELLICYIWILAFYGAENWTLRRVDKKYKESFEMCCWRRMEKISWTDRVRNEGALQTVKQDGNILQTVKGRRDNWIGHILHRNCLLKDVI